MVSPLRAWTPGTGNPTAADGFVVDPMDRKQWMLTSGMMGTGTSPSDTGAG